MQTNGGMRVWRVWYLQLRAGLLDRVEEVREDGGWKGGGDDVVGVGVAVLSDEVEDGPREVVFGRHGEFRVSRP